MSRYDKFHFLTVISNPCLYKSRFTLYEEFKEELEYEGAKLWTLELATGDRSHQITDPNKDHHIQLWCSNLAGEVWNKECLLNAGLAHLTRHQPDWRYVAWIDADVRTEPGIVKEMVKALQHYDIIQGWSHCVDLGPNKEIVGNIHKSYLYAYWNGIEVYDKSGYAQGSHPGFLWAARRDALNKLGVSLSTGPLIDFGALGSGDRHMAAALVGKVDSSVHGETHPNYRKWLKRWQDKSERAIKRNVGYIHHTLRHGWHGRKSDRGYSSRWKLLVKHQFDPETDLRRDVSGMWILNSETPRQIAMRDDFRRYFNSRNEDSIDT